MPQPPDAAAELVLALPPRGRRWVIPGGDETDDAVTLYVITTPDTGLSRRYRVTLPLEVDEDGVLTVAEAAVVEELDDR